jgi:YebC/PmpR family DNA-binding regulatory protein
MAGHSKWANIKHRKMAKDSKKGAAFAKVSREVIMAAKLGGPDPAGNFRLRTAIDRAKAVGLTAESIERGIAKGSGKLGADQVEHLHYEGYGPGGVAIYIETITDNRNRTAGDIRSYFNKYQGNLGETGCVGWLFHERSRIIVNLKTMQDEDTLLELVLEHGADDMLTEENESEIIAPPDKLDAICVALQQSGYPVASAEMIRQPENTIQVTEFTQAKPLLRLLDALESHDDVQAVYANFEMDDALIEQCTPQ